MIKRLKYAPIKGRPWCVFGVPNGHIGAEQYADGIDAICWDGLRKFVALPRWPIPIWLCFSDKPVEGDEVFMLKLGEFNNTVVNIKTEWGWSWDFYRVRTANRIRGAFLPHTRELWAWVEYQP